MRRILLLALLLLAAPVTARAQWVTALNADNHACNAIRGQTDPIVVPDGQGGVITAWRDVRSGSRYEIYAQHTDANGYNLWGAQGTVVDTSLGTLAELHACSDDSGGVILVWYRATITNPKRLIAQRIDANGQLRWAPGYRVSTLENTQTLPRVVADGQGGALVIWAGWIGASAVANIDGQRLDRNGTRLWSASGDSVMARGEVRSLVMVRRAAGGAYIGYWRSNGVISAWAIDNDNHGLWTGPDSITTAPMNTAPPAIGGTATNDGAVFWVGDGTKLLTRKFDDSGAAWSSSRWVATHAYTKNVPRIVTDGAGGAIVSWRDGRPGDTFSAYAQRMAADGTPGWTPDGERVGTPITLNGGGHALAADGLGGAWIATSGYPGEWVQHISSTGAKWLPEGGVNISSTASYFGYDTGTILPGTGGSWILAIQDDTQGATAEDITLKRFFGDGSLSTVGVRGTPADAPSLALSAGPNPARDRATLRFVLPRGGSARLEVFGLRGERVATLADGAMDAGAHASTLDLRALPPGVYHARLVTDAGTATARIAHVR